MSEKAKKLDQPASPTDDAGEAQAQAQADQESEQGYRGYHVDPTPNAAYTVSGVTSGEPTPETDADAATAAASRQAELEQKGGAR